MVINTLYLAIIIKTYIPFSSGTIKPEDHILPAQCLSWDSQVTLRTDLLVFNDRPPLISWWRKNAATAEKDDHRKAQDDVCFRPLSICHPYQATLTQQKHSPRVAVAIPHVLRGARGHNESLLGRLIPGLYPGYQLQEALSLQHSL